MRIYSANERFSRIESLLEELSAKARNSGNNLIKREDVEEILHIKTGIPGSSVSDKEKATLLELENLLHRRVIGQDEAVKAISDSMRRSRSGITNPNRPIGSFLFLGPTGVGKTETAKSLADVFFGGDTEMIRLDMSEFSASDALNRLIGDFVTHKPGVLVSRLREKPYGLLLLDEFEKANSEVHDLFLQILDEGVFSDMRGEEVNALHTIIIATSNAGSDLIWNLMSENKNLSNVREQIIDHIIDTGIFRPELINRFDSSIIFRPLNSFELTKIAEKILERLNKRLSGQGYEISFTPDLIARLVKIGGDPKFGARPIERAVKERIEGAIAKKILEGTLKMGEKLALNASDLA